MYYRYVAELWALRPFAGKDNRLFDIGLFSNPPMRQHISIRVRLLIYIMSEIIVDHQMSYVVHA